MLKRVGFYEERVRKLNGFLQGHCPKTTAKSEFKPKIHLLHTASRNYRKKSYYETLEVTPNATQAQIKAAYYRLSMIHHPDKSQGQTDIENRFQAITEAYETLSNTDKRRNYDRGILVHSPGEGWQPTSKGHDSIIRRKRPEAYGRTEQYNFDEFYKMHYGSTLRKRSINKMQYEQYMRQQEHKKQESISLMSIVMGAMIIGILGLSLIPNPYDSPPQPDSKSR